MAEQDPDDITWWTEFNGDRLWWLYMPATSPDQMYSEADEELSGLAAKAVEAG